jgi:hypothetical protein
MNPVPCSHRVCVCKDSGRLAVTVRIDSQVGGWRRYVLRDISKCSARDFALDDTETRRPYGWRVHFPVPITLWTGFLKNAPAVSDHCTSCGHLKCPAHDSASADTKTCCPYCSLQPCYQLSSGADVLGNVPAVSDHSTSCGTFQNAQLANLHPRTRTPVAHTASIFHFATSHVYVVSQSVPSALLH